MNATTRSAGPLCEATLIVSDLGPVVSAYAALGLAAGTAGVIDATQARAWGHAALAGARSQSLTAGGMPLLRLIEQPQAKPRLTRFNHGWLALEILVRDVDALAAVLPDTGFEVIGVPADLDVSPSIRAMQVIGPAGEMLYLTQVKAAVPPFAIPLSTALPPQQQLGPLFIAVMSTPSRDAAMAACAPLSPLASLRFDTKITVLNRALGHPLDKRWPVATVQLGGSCLFEVDEVVDDRVIAAATTGTLPTGLAWIGLESDDPNPTLLELSPGAWIERLPRHGRT